MRTLIACLTATLFLPTVAFAQTTATAYAERSEVVATGKTIQLFGVPTISADGETQYFDVTVTLPLTSGGTFGNKATVKSVRSPIVDTTEFIPGTYTWSNASYTCSVLASPFGGRTEFDMTCTESSGLVQLIATWYTGPIAGNPYEAELTQAGLNTLSGNDQYSWGRVNQYNTTILGCFNSPDLFGARQIGNTLTLTNFGSNTIVDCQANLNKAP
ncbi:hypothetical protein [Gloeobacter kilaueensis]|uniref:Secreted protein n=1 Tax=Gloeobacter kilaueensis (strain ATCC BAA-2537 / CCAP 1431/1 / ULC 316 / JS1) TaxID=1183438 RepID=U5QCM8_GLOK1|nr:hypothetical protein [Gloeobacter kilaueensis]AGY56598.1 hypothetical protein GKIL_0351 [Gloeobacter kilaueensis JS1]